jgi:hypothetical protein
MQPRTDFNYALPRFNWIVNGSIACFNDLLNHGAQICRPARVCRVTSQGIDYAMTNAYQSAVVINTIMQSKTHAWQNCFIHRTLHSSDDIREHDAPASCLLKPMDCCWRRINDDQPTFVASYRDSAFDRVTTARKPPRTCYMDSRHPSLATQQLSAKSLPSGLRSSANCIALLQDSHIAIFGDDECLD